MMMTMTIFLVGIHGEPGVKRVNVRNAEIMSFCTVIMSHLRVILRWLNLCETTTLRRFDFISLKGTFCSAIIDLSCYFQVEKADVVVKTMIDHMTDVQSGATYKLGLKQGQEFTVLFYFYFTLRDFSISSLLFLSGCN